MGSHVPTERSYIHQKCEETTLVDGGHFSALADPLADMKQTFCAQCEDYFPVNEFRWDDTNETLSKYYARHSRKASSLDRFLAKRDGLFALSLTGMAVGVLLGVALIFTVLRGPVMGTLAVLGLGFAGLITGFLLQAFVVNPMLLKKVCGTSDPRTLK